MATGTSIRRAGHVLLPCLCLAAVVHAHDHHETGPADETVPIDSILWLHIIVQSAAWFVLLPLSIVLGLTRHRLHVPTAVVALLLTSSGYVMGHKHGGRRFPHSAHGSVGSLLIPVLFLQGSLGTYLRLHLKWRGEARVRPVVLFLHGLVGKSFAVLGWLQMLLGVIALRSWCRGGATGQCLAHHIMGSAFVAYAIILLIMMKAGVDWLKRRNMSQEMLDSSVIFLWGCVNALTEHQGGPWTHKDLQHTMLGVVWVAGGAAGMWVSRKGNRSVIPSVVIALTGWAMSGHAQSLVSGYARQQRRFAHPHVPADDLDDDPCSIWVHAHGRGRNEDHRGLLSLEGPAHRPGRAWGAVGALVSHPGLPILVRVLAYRGMCQSLIVPLPSQPHLAAFLIGSPLHERH